MAVIVDRDPADVRDFIGITGEDARDPAERRARVVQAAKVLGSSAMGGRRASPSLAHRFVNTFRTGSMLDETWTRQPVRTYRDERDLSGCLIEEEVGSLVYLDPRGTLQAMFAHRHLDGSSIRDQQYGVQAEFVLDDPTMARFDEEMAAAEQEDGPAASPAAAAFNSQRIGFLVNRAVEASGVAPVFITQFYRSLAS